MQMTTDDWENNSRRRNGLPETECVRSRPPQDRAGDHERHNAGQQNDGSKVLPHCCRSTGSSFSARTTPFPFLSNLSSPASEVRSSMEDLLSMLPMTGVRCPCSRYQSFSFPWASVFRG